MNECLYVWLCANCYGYITFRKLMVIYDPNLYVSLYQYGNLWPKLIGELVSVVETQSRDDSAYISANVISIVNGQIFLSAYLFNVGIRPTGEVNICFFNTIDINSKLKVSNIYSNWDCTFLIKCMFLIELALVCDIYVLSSYLLFLEKCKL